MAAGRFFWYELMTPDRGASIDFYGHVIGWSPEPYMDGGYTVLRTPNEQAGVAGVLQLDGDMADSKVPPSWIGYVSSADVDATVTRAKTLGATIKKSPTFIPGVGRFAVLADPQGAPFVVMQPDGPADKQFPPPNAVGNVAWHELNTTSHQDAWTFYSTLFGWKHTGTLDMGEFGPYWMFGLPGGSGDGDAAATGAMSELAGLMKREPHWLYYVTVADLDGALARVREKQGQVINGPTDVPGGGRMAQCLDPQGAMFALYEE